MHSLGYNTQALFPRLLFIGSLISQFISFYTSPFKINLIMQISKLVRDSYEKKEKDSASIDRLQAARWASEDEVSHLVTYICLIYLKPSLVCNMNNWKLKTFQCSHLHILIFNLQYRSHCHCYCYCCYFSARVFTSSIQLVIRCLSIYPTRTYVEPVLLS